MRNKLTVFTFLFFCNILLAQTQEIDIQLKKKILKSKKKVEKKWCEEGINLAIKDYSKGIRKFYYWGDGYSDSNDSLFRIILKAEYGIVIEDLGCSPSADEMCYSDFMYKKIEADKGKDFFKNIKKRVKLSIAK